ncbi:MAG: hypothetical protein ACI8XO_002451 [Verrucomicrobiales bacterium]
MSVEFFGLPGSGKSYLCESLGKQLAGRDMQIDGCAHPPVDLQPRLRLHLIKQSSAWRFAIRHPVLASRIVRIIQRSGQASKRHVVTKSINLFAELTRCEKFRNRLVSEQGVLQAIWSVALRARRPVIDDLVTLALPWLPTIIVQVDVDRAEHLRRLDEREGGRSRLDRMEGQALSEELDRGAVLLAEIVRSCERLVPSAQWHRVENLSNRDSFQVLRPVIEAISESLGNRTQPSS